MLFRSKERARLVAEIEAEQKTVSRLNEEAAPIRAEVRKVEAEVGPIKYIAHLLYGENPDANVLEKAVIWVTVLIVIVLDPLAVVLLLASQYSFQRFREINQEKFADWTDQDLDELAMETLGETPDPYVPDVGEKPTAKELSEIAEGKVTDSTSTATTLTQEEMDALLTAFSEPAPHHPDTHPYLRQGFKYPEGWEPVGPLVAVPETTVNEDKTEIKEPVRTVITGNRAQPRVKVFKSPIQPLTTITEDIVQEQLEEIPHHTVVHMGNGYVKVDEQIYHEGSVPPHVQGYIQNEEQRESGVWSQVKKNEG